MDNLRDALRDMLGPKAGIGVTDPAVTSTLWPEEAAAVSRAIPKRETEFAAGRHAAREALAQLGLEPMAIPQGADRAPVWPEGITGSISHCAHCCIAVAAHKADYQSLGVDVEPATPLDADLIDVICTPSEQAWLADQPNSGLAAKLIFSAKEAFYKAQYPLTGEVIGFDAVTVAITDSRFEATTTLALPSMKGAIRVHDDLIVTVAYA